MGRTFANAFFRELRFLKGSPWDLALSTVVPVFFLVAMAALFINSTLDDLPVVAVDCDHSALSREALSKLDAAPGTAIVAESPDLKNALSFIRSGRAYGVFYIPKDAEKEVKAGRQATAVLFANSSYFAAALIIGRDAHAAVSGLGVSLATDDTARVDPKGVRRPPLAVQVSTVGNPYFSYELMIVSMLHPGLIIIFLSCAVITSVGREFRKVKDGSWLPRPSLAFPGLLGKLLPYFLIYLFYGAVCVVWLAWGRGYPVAGSLWVLMLGYALMLAAYIALGALIEACVRDQAMSLGAAAVYASSAITFSGAFFPIRGGVWFAQAWSAIQPYTWYTAISAQQWQMGAPASVSFGSLFALAAEVAVLSAGAVLAVWYEARERERTP